MLPPPVVLTVTAGFAVRPLFVGELAVFGVLGSAAKSKSSAGTKS